jgi:hypothetical protein
LFYRGKYTFLKLKVALFSLSPIPGYQEYSNNYQKTTSDLGYAVWFMKNPYPDRKNKNHGQAGVNRV